MNPSKNAHDDQFSFHQISTSSTMQTARDIVHGVVEQVAGGDVITPSDLRLSFAIFTFLGLRLHW
jgi:hypothetical protein